MLNRIKHMAQFIIFGLCVLFTNISYAQSETWWAWTYDSTNGEMIWLDSTGFIRKSVILPKPRGYENYSYTYQVAVAPTGDRVAYTVAGNNGEVVLAVYHLTNDYVMMTYSLPVTAGVYVEYSLNYYALPSIFSTDGRYLAFAYRVEDVWGMYVFDTSSNGVAAYSLFSTMPNAPLLGTFELPVPVYLTQDTLHFTVTTVGDMDIGQPSYALNYMTGAVTPTTYFPTVGVSIEPRTGEAIYPALDNRFGNRSQQIQGIGAHLNSVQVYAPSMAGYVFPFYVDEVNTIDSAYFIQNGELILLRTTEIDGDSYGNHIVIDRAGNRRGILPYTGLWLYPVFSIGEGFVFMTSTADLAPYFSALQNANSTALVVVDTTQGIDGNIGRVIYTGVNGTGARLVWASDVMNRALPNMQAWIEIFPVALGNPPVIPPTAVSNNPPILFVPLVDDVFYEPTLRNNMGDAIPIYFEWSIGAVRYALELQICNGASCDWVIALYTADTFSSFDIINQPFGTYRWRVVPFDANDVQGTPSEWRYFTYTN